MTKTIWTIGHSSRTEAEFISMLHSFDIRMLADIRSYPGSGRYPYFNKKVLSASLQHEQIGYVHLPALGGGMKPRKDSVDANWRNASLRGYADYMETEAFRNAISHLEAIAMRQNSAYMCPEAVLVVLSPLACF